jgi:hypothetical protein
MTPEQRQILIDNPDVPIYAWVDTECVGGDDYAYWYSEVAEIWLTEIVKHPAGAYGDSDWRMWERSEADELRDDYIADDPERWLGDGQERWLGNERSFSDAEITEVAGEYVERLPWEKCILMRVVPALG